MKQLILKTDIENANFYLASLAIGLLVSMKEKKIPLEAGIWSVARPIFWQNLVENEAISDELIEIISTFDEIDFCPNSTIDTDNVIDELLNKLLKIQSDNFNEQISLAMTTELN